MSLDSTRSISFLFPRRDGRKEIPSTDSKSPPAISTIVGARSIFTTTSLIILFASTPGPRTNSGTRISEIHLEVFQF